MVQAVAAVAQARTIQPKVRLAPIRTLECAPGQELPYIAAASGLVKLADTYWVVADDQNFMSSFRQSGPCALIRVLPGDLPANDKDRKLVKPDFEALVHLAAGTTGLPNDILLALGSGSKPNRFRGIALGVDKAGATRGAPQVVDLTPLYAVLKPNFTKLNIEGAAVYKNTLVLAQRGNGLNNTNALIELDLKAVVSAITNKRPIGAEALRKITRVELGTIRDVPWSFTDLAALSNGSFVFTAAAEASRGTVDDGLVIGAALGVVSADGHVVAFTELDPTVKLEGVHVTRETRDSVELALVSDADDPNRAAVLYRATLAF